jgi:hypothetical protein
MNVRLVPAPISLEFSENSINKEIFSREYNQLSETDDDPVSQWLKLAKAKGETSESDPILLNLIVELHRKIDSLEMFLKDEKPIRVSLINQAEIKSIGFDHFKINDDILEVGQIYYGRIAMPVHPKRDVAIYFKALEPSLAKITMMHDRDEKEWAAYMTARERVLIREIKKAKKDE